MLYNYYCKFLRATNGSNDWIPSSYFSVFTKFCLFSRTSSNVNWLKQWICLACLFKWLVLNPLLRIVPQWLHFSFATPPTFIFVKWSQQFEITLYFLFLLLCVSSSTFSISATRFGVKLEDSEAFSIIIQYKIKGYNI